MLVFYNGKIINEASLDISEISRALWHSDGLFTTIRISDGEIEDFDAHMERLKKQSKYLDIKAPNLDVRELLAYIKAVKAFKGTYRLKLMLIPKGESSTPYWKDLRKGIFLARIDLYKELTSSLKVKIYPSPMELPVHPIKGHAYAHRIWLKKWALSLGYDDALCCDKEGYLLELSTSNIFWILDRTLYTPNFNTLQIFQGIALRKHLNAFEDHGGRVELVKISVKNLPRSAKIYSCNVLNQRVRIAHICE
jgi:branched-subunit amino acid aminotransferase/4-amino-4-deoxychorismate lyase